MKSFHTAASENRFHCETRYKENQFDFGIRIQSFLTHVLPKGREDRKLGVLSEARQ